MTLHLNQSYVINVQQLTDKISVTFLTNPVPGAPTGLIALNISGQNAFLTWDPPMFANGILQSYQLTYSTATPTIAGCTTRRFVRLRRPGHEFQMQTQLLALENLCPDTEYTVVLTASTRQGEGASRSHAFNTSG